MAPLGYSILNYIWGTPLSFLLRARKPLGEAPISCSQRPEGPDLSSPILAWAGFWHKARLARQRLRKGREARPLCSTLIYFSLV